jgi:hypothetical protein
MSSTTAASMVTSAAVSGSPPSSQTRWSLLPGLPRSTGFAPTWSPTTGAHAHGVHARPRPVQLALLAQPVQDGKVQGVEHAGSGPLGEPAPAGRRRATAKLAGGQQPPRGGGPRHEYDRGKAVTVGDGPLPATVGRRGGIGSKGSTSAHSSSGTSSSARVVMARDPARPTRSERNADLPRRNLDCGLAGWRLPTSDTVRISSYFRTL